jgi:hypothetical protein
MLNIYHIVTKMTNHANVYGTVSYKMRVQASAKRFRTPCLVVYYNSNAASIMETIVGNISNVPRS